MCNPGRSVLTLRAESSLMTRLPGPREGLWPSEGAGRGAEGKGAVWGTALPPLGLFFLVLPPLQLGFSVEEVHLVGQEVGAGGPCSVPPGPGGGPPWVPDPLGWGRGW